jgi:hypothetical protein
VLKKKHDSKNMVKKPKLKRCNSQEFKRIDLSDFYLDDDPLVSGPSPSPLVDTGSRHIIAIATHQ